MSVRSGQPLVREFTTRNPTTGVRANADSLPTGTLVVQGADNAAVVSVSNVTTGRYKASLTLPALAATDLDVELAVVATVAGVTDSDVVWRDDVDPASTTGTVIAVTDTKHFTVTFSGLDGPGIANQFAGNTIEVYDPNNPQLHGSARIVSHGTVDSQPIAFVVQTDILTIQTGHFVAIAFDAPLELSASGNGDTAVNHNTGGTDNLRVTDSAGSGLDNITLRAYLTTDYTTGNLGANYIKGTAITGSDGRWAAPMFLNSGSYTIVTQAQGTDPSTSKAVTV